MLPGHYRLPLCAKGQTTDGSPRRGTNYRRRGLRPRRECVDAVAGQRVDCRAIPRQRDASQVEELWVAVLLLVVAVAIAHDDAPSTSVRDIRQAPLPVHRQAGWRGQRAVDPLQQWRQLAVLPKVPDARRTEEVELTVHRQRTGIADLDAAERVCPFRIESATARQVAPYLAARRIEDVEIAVIAGDGGGGFEFLDATDGERRWLLAGPQREQVARAVEDQQAAPYVIPRNGARFARDDCPVCRIDAIHLGDFLIDQFEVTNAEFKKFIAAGGYQKRQYWKQPFIKDGKPVSFEIAMREFVDGTGSPGPATWEVGDFPKGQADAPVGGVSWYEASAYAEFAGKRLPTIFHWNGAAQTQTSPVVVPASNFEGHGPWAAGSHRSIGQYGAYDMAGNLKEWCSNEAEPGKRYILGGAWNEPNYMFIDQDAQNAWSRAATFGLRTMKVSSPDGIPRDAERAIWIPLRDYSKEKPVSDDVFTAYRSLYSYDRTPLNAVIESADSRAESWTVQKISFDAAYGNERVIAYLYLPKNARPPYQAVVFFPGSNAIHTDSLGGTPGAYGEFVAKAGRALMFPIYKGTYQRRDALKSDYPAPTAFYRDHVIAWAKDLRRSIDYLETRSDIDHVKLAYIGMSWGGAMGPIMAAVEPRLKTCIFISGGFDFQHALPEADQINFAPRVKQPVLMLNARYDHFFPVESSQMPMLHTIGTADGDKKYIVYESGHAPPRLEVTKESLAWLDRYLGPVAR